MAVVEGQKLKADSSTFKTGDRQSVIAIGNNQRYPALSPSKYGLKAAVIAQGTKLVIAESATTIRKVTKLFGQLFP